METSTYRTQTLSPTPDPSHKITQETKQQTWDASSPAIGHGPRPALPARLLSVSPSKGVFLLLRNEEAGGKKGALEMSGVFDGELSRYLSISFLSSKTKGLVTAADDHSSL